MPRDIAKSNFNLLTVHDGMADDDVAFFHRWPTTDERVAYRNAALKLKGRSLKNKVTETNIRFGGKLITGFIKSELNASEELEGGLVYNGKPFSSFPIVIQDYKNIEAELAKKESASGDPDYLENWKQLVIETSADLIEQVGAVIFGGVGVVENEEEEEEFEFEEEKKGEEVPVELDESPLGSEDH